MIQRDLKFQQDIDDIAQIPIVSRLLDVVCQTTGMGFAAIARVTEDNWITCSVHDDINFGLKPGDELEIKTTICDEIRMHQKSVVIDHVATDPNFSHHHTPLMYGFQSYISMPIIRKNGSFFGTLCAIDPKPHHVSSPAVTGMFSLFADLISFHLQAIETFRESETLILEERNKFSESENQQKVFTEALEKKVLQRTMELEEKNGELNKMNTELQSFAYISSHDLQEPLRKIQIFSSIIQEKETENLSQTGKEYFDRIKQAASRMQSLINDLLTYSRTDSSERKFELTDLSAIVEDVKDDLRDEISQKNAVIESHNLILTNVIPFQFRQLLYNLISNSLKFSFAQRTPKIVIQSSIGIGKEFDNEMLSEMTRYCHISVTDNGIGFDQQYDDRIFGLFQRLHDKNHYKGTGIGLAIVKKIVENHHGIITAKGQLNQGAKFDIYLPMI